MVTRVPLDKIEKIVGVKRAEYEHYGRADSKTQMTYILHSQACLDTNRIMYDCIYTVAQEKGIDPEKWPEDTPVILRIHEGRLVPRETATPKPKPKRTIKRKTK